MQYKRYAGIDIGSNAVRLIIKDVLPGQTYANAVMNKRVYVRLPLRLGGDVFQYNKIKKPKQKDFINAIKIYKQLIDFYKVEKIRACATSAVRNANNGLKIINNINKKTGIEIEIISGEEEASLIFETNRYNLPDKRTYLSADLGGGSLQLTIFKNDSLIWTHSYKIGTVRMLNNKVSDKEMDKFKNKLQEIELQFPDLQLLGTGGNINALSKFLGNKKVTQEGLEQVNIELNKLSVEERMRKFKFKADRADVIIPALKVYSLIMKIINKNEIYVPKTGLADGIIRQLYEHDFGKNV